MIPTQYIAYATAATEARLCHVTDAQPGIRRESDGANGFRYRYPNGSPVTDEATLARLAGIAFPPAYTEAWFCPCANGHLQASGRDARRRKQYRYHPLWRQARAETKFDRIVAFGDALPHIRARAAEDLTRHGLPREKVLAAAVQLLEMTRMRVGNEEYAQSNGHYGLTTLRHRHVSVTGETVTFAFVGKAGVVHKREVRSERLAQIVREMRELPGQMLFQYRDPATIVGRRVTSGDVNDYLCESCGVDRCFRRVSANLAGGEGETSFRLYSFPPIAPANTEQTGNEVSGALQDFTAKDFRTWGATVLCAMALSAASGVARRSSSVEENTARAVRQVARMLGNTPSVCRKCYIHPAVIEDYANETESSRRLMEAIRSGENGSRNGTKADFLSPTEAAVLRFLRDRQKGKTHE